MSGMWGPTTGHAFWLTADCLPFSVGAQTCDAQPSPCGGCTGPSVCRYDAHSSLPVPGPAPCFVPGGGGVVTARGTEAPICWVPTPPPE